MAVIETAIEPATKPSKPSIKLVKLITAVTEINNKTRTGRKDTDRTTCGLEKTNAKAVRECTI